MSKDKHKKPDAFVSEFSAEEIFRKHMVSLVEDRLLNAQRQIRHEISDTLQAFDKRLSSTLQEVRERHFYDIEKEFQENRFYFNEKVFRFKESPLTDYFKIENYRTLYNIAVSTLILLMINLIFTDYYQYNEIFDMATLTWCFNHNEKVFQPWILMFVVSLTIIPLVRQIILNKIGLLIWVPLYSLHIGTIMYIGCRSVYQGTFGLGSAMIIQCEMVRMILKNHSYLRTKLLYCTQNSYKNFIPSSNISQGFSPEKLSLPSIDIQDFFTELQRYLYFHFSPTLIYRDQYVQAPKRSRNQIIFHLVNFLLCIYFGFILFKCFCKPQIIYFSLNINLRSFVQVWFQLMLPGTLSIILLFYGLLHSWLNCWAEIMRFPDRTFYLDWWNSGEFGSYYRKWNVVVHEWLFYYVYGDIVRFSRGSVSKNLASLSTFIISAIIHEVIISFVLGFFYPILFLIFAGPGVLLIRKGLSNTSQYTNIIFWLLMYIGTGLILTLYLTEYYARSKVDNGHIEKQWGYFSHIVPRTFYLY